MDKFVVRLAASVSAPSQGDEALDERPTKRAKTKNARHNSHDGTFEQAAGSRPSPTGLIDDEDDAGCSSDGEVGFEEPLAAVECLEAVDGPCVAEDGTPVDAPLYRSSIYVDAFNMALDTVLEQEVHLFNEKEKAVFDAWRRLDYEAQYLYARLFLRKEAAWFREDRLDYASDIGNLQEAIGTLREARDLPPCEDEAPTTSFLDPIAHEWALGSSFTFAQVSDNVKMSVDDALGLLHLDEMKILAKEVKASGKTKAQLQASIVHMVTTQPMLVSTMPRRLSSAVPDGVPPAQFRGESNASGRKDQLMAKVMAMTGPCIRIFPSVFKLFSRVHLVFYRTAEWTEKSLTTIVLAKMSKRNFPDYVVSRTANVFASRQDLVDFETALQLRYRVDRILNLGGPPGEDGHREVVALFHGIAEHWRALVQDEQQLQEAGSGDGGASYLSRFRAGHVLTRIAHYAAHCHGRLHEYAEEHALLGELLGQRVFHRARRGFWYRRRALLEEHYMCASCVEPWCGDDESQRKKHWCRKALKTCEQALQDHDCHVIYHYDVQKRITKLERRLRIPRRLQHDFGHLRLRTPEEHYVEGVQLKAEGGRSGAPGGGKAKSKTSAGGSVQRTVWRSANDGAACSVEDMCLEDYERRGWKGYHSEGGIVRTLFAYLFFDVLFLPVPNVFQTPYQSCPLDLHTDVFYAVRAAEVNRRLVEIANGAAPRIVRDVHAAHAARRTCVVGLDWAFALDDVVELAQCFRGDALALVCKVLAQEYRQRGGGLPDLLLWRMAPEPDLLFAEVKSANDRLSDTQKMWIHVLAGAGLRVAVCHAVAKEVRTG